MEHTRPKKFLQLQVDCEKGAVMSVLRNSSPMNFLSANYAFLMHFAYACRDCIGHRRRAVQAQRIQRPKGSDTADRAVYYGLWHQKLKTEQQAHRYEWSHLKIAAHSLVDRWFVLRRNVWFPRHSSLGRVKPPTYSSTSRYPVRAVAIITAEQAKHSAQNRFQFNFRIRFPGTGSDSECYHTFSAFITLSSRNIHRDYRQTGIEPNTAVAL